jgi:hypothetical protein
MIQVTGNLTSHHAGIKLLAYDAFFRDKGYADNDRRLINATQDTGIVYYPVVLYSRNNKKNEESDVSDSEKHYIISQNIWHPEVFQKGNPPVSELSVIPFHELSTHAKGLGHVNIDPDRDWINRTFPLLYQYRDGYIPLLIFRMICDFLEVTASNINVLCGKHIVLKNAQLPDNIVKDITIPIDEKGSVIINYVAPWKDSFFEFPVKEMLEAEKNRGYMLELYDKVEGSVAIISGISGTHAEQTEASTSPFYDLPEYAHQRAAGLWRAVASLDILKRSET